MAWSGDSGFGNPALLLPPHGRRHAHLTQAGVDERAELRPLSLYCLALHKGIRETKSQPDVPVK